MTSNDTHIVYEREGEFHLFELATRESVQLRIEVTGDFPWVQKKWEM